MRKRWGEGEEGEERRTGGLSAIALSLIYIYIYIMLPFHVKVAGTTNAGSQSPQEVLGIYIYESV